MTNWLAIIVNVFYMLWAIALLVLLWLNLRVSLARLSKAEKALLDVTTKNAESAHTSADAALRAVEINARLVMLLEAEQKDNASA